MENDTTLTKKRENDKKMTKVPEKWSRWQKIMYINNVAIKGRFNCNGFSFSDFLFF